MKKFLLILLICPAVNAQDLFETMSIEICNCIKAKRPDVNATAPEDLKNDYMACFLTSFGQHGEEVMAIENGKYSDRNNMSEFGQNIAMRMITHCPDHLMALGVAMDDEEIEPESSEDVTVEGKISDIRTNEFITVVLKDKESNTHNLMLMDFFDTASVLTDKKIKKNDTISATYSEIQMYDPKMKEFRYYKVLTSIEKK